MSCRWRWPGGTCRPTRSPNIWSSNARRSVSTSPSTCDRNTGCPPIWVLTRDVLDREPPPGEQPVDRRGERPGGEVAPVDVAGDQVRPGEVVVRRQVVADGAQRGDLVENLGQD